MANSAEKGNGIIQFNQYLLVWFLDVKHIDGTITWTLW